MGKLAEYFSRAYTILEEDGPLVLGERVRTFLSLRMQYLRRWRKRRRVKSYKREIDDGDGEYNHDPRVSFAVQSFNRAENIDHLATHIPQSKEYETIVLEDGSVDGSLERWDEHLTRRNDFLIRSNDLHELRTYSRCARFARGKYLCLLQDDDTLPDQEHWIEWALDYFDSFPDLAVVGGYFPVGLGEMFDSGHDSVSHDGSIPPIAEWTFTSNDEKFPLMDDRPLAVIDPRTERPLTFVPIVSVGPFIIDLDVLHEIGGFDFDFSEPGMPAVMFDGEFCLRCWEAGYKVGYANMGNYGNVLGGTELYAAEDRDEQAERNVELIVEKHGSRFDTVEKRVCDANADLTMAEEPSEVEGLNLT